MSRMIFVNLPVKDLTVARDFFAKLGFSHNPEFSDENAACVVISDTIYVMLLTEPFFGSFISKQIADTTTSCETLLCLSADSREEVDRLVETALSSGGRPSGKPVDEGPMYGRAFEDPDGHIWEVMHMSMATAEQG